MSRRFLEKAFNVYESESGRVFYSWLLRFVHKFGLVMGWTTVIAIFVARYSIASLPFLFLVQAGLMISGTIFYSFVADRYESKILLVISGFAAALFLFAAGLFFENDMVFFPLVLIANGFLLQQISVFLSSYIEDLFSPVEANRVFPVIDSAETIAGIFAGLILAYALSGAGGQIVFFFWVFSLIVFIGILVFMYPRSSRFYCSLYEMKLLSRAKRIDWSGIKNGFMNISRIPFLQVMASVFFMQWFVAQLIEFQFTKVVDEGVLNSSTLSSHAESLAHGLGSLQVLFFGSALVVQLLLASRILRFLGTVGGLFLHGIMTLMSAVSMIVGFGYFTTLMVKNNFEVSGVISKNAYEASYYAFPHGTQKTLREFFEGVLAPLATIAGTIFLLLIGKFFVEKDALLAINVMLLLIAVFTVFLCVFLQKYYSMLVGMNLSPDCGRITKFHAIDILEEKGHRHGAEALASALNRENDPSVLIRILHALSRIGTVDCIPSVEKLFENEFPDVRIAAALVLGDMSCLKSGLKSILVIKHRLIEKLKLLSLSTGDSDFKLALIRTLCSLEDHNLAGLLDMLKNGDPLIQIECIDILASYADKSVITYLRPLMFSNDYFVKAKAIVAILGINNDDSQAKFEMEKMILCNDPVCRQSVFAEFWNLPFANIDEIMKKALGSHDPLTRLYASVGLIRSGNSHAAVVLADLLLFQNNLFLGKVKSMFKGIDIGMKKIINIGMKKVLAVEIEKAMIRKSGFYWKDDWSIGERLELMGEAMLRRLGEAFRLVGLEEEVELINAMIEYRDTEVPKSSISKQLFQEE